MTNQELIEALVEIDDSDDVDVSPGDARFLETIVRKEKAKDWNLSVEQRKWAEDILERYGECE